MHVLVTGGAGFIGSSLVSTLLQSGHKVTVVDNFNDYYNPDFKRQNIQRLVGNNNFTLAEGDILETDFLHSVFRKNVPEKVVHLAASVGVRNSLDHPEEYSKNNLIGTQNILDTVGLYGVKQFIFASSSSIYGNSSPTPFREDQVVDTSLNPYAMTKKIGESLCLKHHNKFHTLMTIFRFFTVYGPKGRPDMSPYIFTKSILEGIPIRIYGDGSAHRDFTYIDDVVSGILLGLGKTFPYEVFNLGSNAPIEILDFVRKIGDLCNKKPNLKFYPRNDFEMLNTYANISRARTLLNYRPAYSLEKGLTEFIKWYKENR